jgi:hypothetical protein
MVAAALLLTGWPWGPLPGAAGRRLGPVARAVAFTSHLRREPASVCRAQAHTSRSTRRPIRSRMRSATDGVRLCDWTPAARARMCASR